MSTKPKPKIDPAKLKANRHTGYHRNMQAMRAFLESHPCSICGRSFPHPAMRFDNPPKGQWPVFRMAGSRCKLTDLQDAMNSTPVFCANCKSIKDWKEAQ